MVEQTVMTANTAAAMTDSNAASIVATGVLLLGFNEALERLLRGDVAHILASHASASWSGWVVSLNCHYFFSSVASSKTRILPSLNVT